MTDTEKKALALVNEVARELGWDQTKEIYAEGYTRNEALFRAIEQHEAFRQEVSDAVEAVLDRYYVLNIEDMLSHLIIPAPKPDPLVDAVHEVDTGPAWDSPEDYCNKIRAALDARGLEIRDKNK